MGKVGNCARAVAVLVRDGRVVVSQACPNDHKDAKQTDLLYSMCLPGRSCAGVGRTNGIARLLLGCILQMNTLCTTHTKCACGMFSWSTSSTSTASCRGRSAWIPPRCVRTISPHVSAIRFRSHRDCDTLPSGEHLESAYCMHTHKDTRRTSHTTYSEQTQNPSAHPLEQHYQCLLAPQHVTGATVHRHAIAGLVPRVRLCVCVCVCVCVCLFVAHSRKGASEQVL